MTSGGWHHSLVRDRVETPGTQLWLMAAQLWLMAVLGTEPINSGGSGITGRWALFAPLTGPDSLLNAS